MPQQSISTVTDATGQVDTSLQASVQHRVVAPGDKRVVETPGGTTTTAKERPSITVQFKVTLQLTDACEPIPYR